MNIVSFDLAKKLKEKGFKTENTDWCYIDGDLVQVKKYINISPYEYAPTISQVLKWLREEEKIAINIEFIPYVWQYKIIDMSYEVSFDSCGKTMFCSYEQAALAGIEYVLDNLI